ncbi:MAG: NAD(P)-binding protein [Aureobasidium pullulans]|nr:MAG: NAD(P)-binding protein [Aureobasidium pullulans]
MSNPLEEQHLSKRRRINSAQPSEPAKQLNAAAISHSKEKKDSALDIKVLFSLPNLPAIALLAPAAAIRRMEPQVSPWPKKRPDRPITPKINPLDASITYPERLNFTQKLLDQALKTARAGVEERKKVNKVLEKECKEVRKEVVEAKRQLAEMMAQQALRDANHAALGTDTTGPDAESRAFISMPTGDAWVLPPIQW